MCVTFLIVSDSRDSGGPKCVRACVAVCVLGCAILIDYYSKLMKTNSFSSGHE